MKIRKRKKIFASSDYDYIKSADETDETDETDENEFEDFSDMETDDYDNLSDSLDEISDQVEDIQDDVDDVVEDVPSIETDNNISNHYIAECDTCHNIFISAVIESDQVVDHVSGICPICEKETDQYLKWVVKDVDNKWINQLY